MKFNLFNRVNLVIDTGGHGGYQRYFTNEYRRIARSSACDDSVPSIHVKIVRQLPAPLQDDVSCSVKVKKLFTFSYLVRGIETDRVCIYFQSHPVDKIYINAIAVFLQAQLLEPVMYLKLLEKDVLLMHAAGVCDERHGYLFPASGGTGKTTFSIALLGHGYRLLGDDLLIVDVENRTVYPYARPLHLFRYNINNLQDARVPWKYRVAIYAKDVLRFILENALRTEFLISTRVHADEIFRFDPFGESVPYAAIFFLRKNGPAISTTKVTAEELPALVQRIMASADLNRSLYELVANAQKTDRIKIMEEDVIGRLLTQFDELTFLNTRDMDLSNLQWFDRDFLGAAAHSDQ